MPDITDRQSGLFEDTPFVNSDCYSQNGNLARRFLAPPFTILDAKQGYWRDRKNAWLELGINGELGRNAPCFNTGDMTAEAGYAGHTKAITRTSVFDPVLCELAYRWWCPVGGQVLDPFAGGSVRGIVANYLGYKYYGIDMSKRQVDANRQQAIDILDPALTNTVLWPIWTVGDSKVKLNDLDEAAYYLEADFIFTCPPYYDLEKYDCGAGDLSMMKTYDQFLTDYEDIIDLACHNLKQNRFACIVVGDFRDKEGNYRNFVGATIGAFLKAGLKLYNEAIYVTPIGTLAIRAGRSFTISRKLGKAHQNVLLFVKGDARKASDLCEKIWE